MKPDPNLIAVFDTETTGLTLHPDADPDKQPKIIELGLALMDGRTGEVVETYNQLIQPGEPLTDEITKITGIADSALVGQPNFAMAAPEFAKLFAKAGHVVAHNLPFDKTMLMNELRRCGVGDFPWPPGEHCTVALHREMWGRNPRLIELYEFAMGKPLAQTHRALDDVLALVEVIKALEIHKAIVA